MEALKQISIAQASYETWDFCKKKALLCLVFIVLFYFTGLQVFSQDPSFSQFITNNLYSNPGYVGCSQKVDMLIHYRRYQTQNPAKFEHIYFSLDYPLDNKRNFGLGGVGIVVFQNNEGDGYLKTSNIGIPFSVRVQMATNFDLQFGVMPSIVLKSINWQDFQFRNQFDEITGYNPNTPPPQIIDGASESIPPFADFSFGLYGKYVSDGIDKANDFSKGWEFGISMHHWPVTVNETFVNRYSRLPYKFVGVVKLTFPMPPEKLKALIQPAFIYEKQGPLSTAMLSARFIKEKYLFGVGLRSEQKRLFSYTNITCEFGLSFSILGDKEKKWWMLLSLDIPTYSQSHYTNTAFEISFNLKLPSNKRPGPVCPEFK